MTPGVVSALGYAYLLIMLPVSIFAYALTTAVFPYLTDAFASHDRPRISHLLSRGITVSLLLALPATMICWIFADKLVILLFKRGAFDGQSVTYTSNLLRYFALGLAGQFIIWIMSRAYYAARKYKILIAHVIIVVASKIILALIFIRTDGYIGLAVSSTISYSIGAVLLLAFTGVVLARVDAKGMTLYVAKVILATAGGYAAAWGIYVSSLADRSSFSDLIVGVPAAIIASLAIFVIIGYGIDIPDIRTMVGTVRRRIGV
jgi:putative peptidoglycan lipid II flippase